ncbi:MAG TPA: ABC transporter ATP-binding protein [Ktedonobacteraceae bacterium]|nr:ABC transporter ATP-binding protein [Ktedonobacteraceae bacterium]
MTSNDVQQTPPDGSSGVHPVNISIHHDVTAPQTAINSVVEQQHQANGTGPQPVIVVRDLKKTYLLGETRVQALRGVSLQVQQGEFVAVMGPSGSGKTTLMNLLGCLDRPSSGDYLLAGKVVSRMSPDELALIRNQLIGFVFQGFNLLSRSTAVKNVAMPLMYAGYSKEEQEYRARKALQLVGLASRLHHRPSQLSGGQQQRVAIARALVNSPSLLLADEPTGNLDSRTSIEIMAVLQALNQRGLTIILVTHEPDIAAYAKRQVAFRDGLLVRDEVMYTSRNAITELSVEKEPTHIVTQEAAE